MSPHEQERLFPHSAAAVARARRDRGLHINDPEEVAVPTSWVLEPARDGCRVHDLMEDGRHVLTRDDVMEGVPEAHRSYCRTGHRYSEPQGGQARPGTRPRDGSRVHADRPRRHRPSHD
ncbi:MAG: urease subunit gamma [Ilumatobacter sp.]